MKERVSNATLITDAAPNILCLVNRVTKQNKNSIETPKVEIESPYQTITLPKFSKMGFLVWGFAEPKFSDIFKAGLG